MGTDLIFNRPLSDYIPFYNPTLTSIPVDYKDCSQYHHQNYLNQLKCSISFSNADKLFQDCSSDGGSVTSSEYGGQICKLTYYNYFFNNWPKSYNQCVNTYNISGNPNICGEVIPETGVYNSKQDLDKINSLVDRCINAGGNTILLAGSTIRFCASTFNR